MFIYKLAFFKEFLKKYAEYYSIQYENLEKAYTNAMLFEKTYKAIKPESIDYALMEKLTEAVMFKAAFTWNDVGSWSSVYEMNSKDRQKNVCRGHTLAIDTRNSLLFSSEKKPLAVIGLDGIAVIDTESGMLIAPMGKLQQVKQVIQILKEKKI
jgi:mannose-1-phosphate guanylyltransferase